MPQLSDFNTGWSIMQIKDNDWIILFLIASLFFVNVLRFVFPNLFLLMVHSNRKNESFLSFFIERKNSIFNEFIITIEALFYAHLALFISSLINLEYLIFDLLETKFNYWKILLFLIFYYVIKRFLIHLIFLAFSQSDFGKMYIVFKVPFHFSLLLFLIIFNSLIYFSGLPKPILMAIAICVLIIAYAYISLLFMVKNYILIKQNVFIFFLYLCALEILPIILAGKMIVFYL